MNGERTIDVSRNPAENFENNAIQFPRLIASLWDSGAVTPEVLEQLREQHNYTEAQVIDVATRAKELWETTKSHAAAFLASEL